MLHVLECFVSLIFLVGYSESKLPDFIKACSRSDPNFSRCIQDHAKDAVPILAEGVKELNIPSLKQFKLPLIYSPTSATYSLIFDGILEGLETIEFLDPSFDYNTLKGQGKIFMTQMKLFGQYTAGGFIENIPINGAGNANITLHDVLFHYTFDFIKYFHDGDIYYTVPTATFKSFQIKSARYHFYNLFNEAEVNRFLNRNWELLSDVLLPQLGVVILKLTTGVANIVMTTAPADHVVLP